jgi:hypothetical protein
LGIRNDVDIERLAPLARSFGFGIHTYREEIVSLNQRISYCNHILHILFSLEKQPFLKVKFSLASPSTNYLD